jgi:hypothetical protein
LSRFLPVLSLRGFGLRLTPFVVDAGLPRVGDGGGGEREEDSGEGEGEGEERVEGGEERDEVSDEAVIFLLLLLEVGTAFDGEGR